MPQVFMPTDEANRNKAKCIMERVAAKLGHDSLTWRVVPTSNKTLGKSAVAVEPHIEQWFLSARGLKDNLETEQQVGGAAWVWVKGMGSGVRVSFAGALRGGRIAGGC
jgi:glutamate synthase domain-containing protein 1